MAGELPCEPLTLFIDEFRSHSRNMSPTYIMLWSIGSLNQAPRQIRLS